MTPATLRRAAGVYVFMFVFATAPAAQQQDVPLEAAPVTIASTVQQAPSSILVRLIQAVSQGG